MIVRRYHVKFVYLFWNYSQQNWLLFPLPNTEIYSICALVTEKMHSLLMKRSELSLLVLLYHVVRIVTIHIHVRATLVASRHSPKLENWNLLYDWYDIFSAFSTNLGHCCLTSFSLYTLVKVFGHQTEKQTNKGKHCETPLAVHVKKGFSSWQDVASFLRYSFHEC